jgi:hypothetical protein
MNLPKITLSRRAHDIILVLLFALFIAYSIYSLLYTRINFDEGSYAYKGYHFIRGDYYPFQDYGLYTNKMPLAFLVPGFFQTIFPGILTGRILAIVFSCIGLLGLYLFAAKAFDRNAGLLAVAVTVFSLSTLTNFSMAITQSMTAALLIWAFYLLVHGNKPWMVYAGGVLSLLAVFTRQNIVFVLPVIWLYVMINKKAGNSILFTLLYLGTFVVFHLPYLPNILTIWAMNIPKQLHLLEQWRPPGQLFVETTGASPSILEQIRSLSETYLMHAVSFLGGFLGLPTLFVKNKTKIEKDLALLVISFWVLAIPHALATVGTKTMNSGFNNLIDFFGFLGILAFIYEINLVNKKHQTGLIIGAVLLLGVSLGHYFKDLFRDSWQSVQLPYFSFSTSSFQTTGAVGLFERIFGLSYEQLYAIVPMMTGVLFMIIVLAGWGIWSTIAKLSGPAANPALITIYIVIFMLSQPINFFLRLTHPGACSANVIRQDQEIRQQITEVITVPAVVMLGYRDDLVYLAGNPSVLVPPASINRPWALITGMDADTAQKYGMYTQALLEKWYNEADYLLNPPGGMIAELDTKIPECYILYSAVTTTPQCGAVKEIDIYQNQCQPAP